jgi:hypothetical protein
MIPLLQATELTKAPILRQFVYSLIPISPAMNLKARAMNRSRSISKRISGLWSPKGRDTPAMVPESLRVLPTDMFREIASHLAEIDILNLSSSVRQILFNITLLHSPSRRNYELFYSRKFTRQCRCSVVAEHPHQSLTCFQALPTYGFTFEHWQSDQIGSLGHSRHRSSPGSRRRLKRSVQV